MQKYSGFKYTKKEQVCNSTQLKKTGEKYGSWWSEDLGYTE